MAQVGGPTAQPVQAGPRTPLQSERQEQKRDLASWWRNFKRSDKKPQDVQGTQSPSAESKPSAFMGECLHKHVNIYKAHATMHPWPGEASKIDRATSIFYPKICDPFSNTVMYTVTQGIFGVPLQQSIRYANVAISLLNDEGQSYIYGYVPIVVAKCGVFLKEKGA